MQMSLAGQQPSTVHVEVFLRYLLKMDLQYALVEYLFLMKEKVSYLNLQ